MSAPTSPTGSVEPPETTPAAIRAELPEELRGQFDVEYQAALEDARVCDRLDRLNEVVQAWWQLVGIGHPVNAVMACFGGWAQAVPGS